MNAAATITPMTTAPTPVEVFKCLADETRARIALLLAREGELCVCEITVALAQAQPKVSRHLAMMRGAGLLDDRRQGQWVHYRLHPGAPDWVVELLQRTYAANNAWLADVEARLAAMCRRPDRLGRCA